MRLPPTLKFKNFPGIFSKRFGKDTAKVRFSALGTAHFSARDCTNVLRDCTFVQYCNLKITPGLGDELEVVPALLI